MQDLKYGSKDLSTSTISVSSTGRQYSRIWQAYISEISGSNKYLINFSGLGSARLSSEIACKLMGLGPQI